MPAKNYTLQKLKWLRRILASTFLALLAWALMSPGEHSKILNTLPKIQFGQIVSGLFSRGSVSLLILFVVYVVLTGFFGRFFCSFLCPLGAGLDLVTALRLEARPKRYKFQPSALWRSIVPIMLLLLFWVGITLPYGLLEPYSVFTAQSAIYFLPPILLFFILSSAYFFGRGFCNSLCPTGFILRLLSRDSFFKLTISDDCIECGLCTRVCPASCVDYKNKNVDYGRCVLCLECVSACPNNSLRYIHRRTLKDGVPFLARRRANMVSVAVLGGAAFLSSEALRAKVIPERERFPVLPPGALSLAHLNAHCSLCHTCIRACPNHALHPSPERELSLWQKPVLNAQLGFCQYDCVECTRVCPTEALLKITVDEKHVMRLAQVRFLRAKCIIIENGTSCGACAELCPTGAVYMADGEIPDRPEPFLKEELCIGCGACQKSCPVGPMPAIWITGLKYQDMLAKRLVKDDSPDAVLEDFPF
ncbi:MAG: 4Fe-4S binding protein [Deltaproteobacteria bacterium]|jgi:polyferredoxin|nr:4Fe-4S binding protein [Deltaproteobacteria bacterium]